MARKIFQDFAHVLCQKFIEVPSNTDLVNLVILGDGRLELDLITWKATHNRGPISPLPYMKEAREWLEIRSSKLEIPSQELVTAVLTVDYTVKLHRRPPLHWLDAQFSYDCKGTIRALDQEYISRVSAEKYWGLGTYGYEATTRLGIRPNLLADLTLYSTSQGGRQSSVIGEWFGCACKINKDDTQAWDCRVLLHGRPMVPGDTRRVGILFLSGEEAASLFRTTDKFYLWEDRVIGEAAASTDDTKDNGSSSPTESD